MGLRSLPFFKAKKGWQFAGGGLSVDGGCGGGSLPVPDGYILRLYTFTDVTNVTGSDFTTVGNIGTGMPLFTICGGIYNSEWWCGYLDCRKTLDGSLQCRAINTTTAGYPLTIHAYVLERSE